MFYPADIQKERGESNTSNISPGVKHVNKSTDTCCNTGDLENMRLSEINWTWKDQYCMILLIWNIKNRQIHRDRK